MRPYYSEPGIELYRGDNLEVLAAIGLKPESAALLWGDPPYGVNYQPVNRAGSGRTFVAVAGDDSPFNPVPWLAYPRAVFWGANHYAHALPPSASWWCWDKRTEAIPERTQADGEMAWTNLGGPMRIFRFMWDGICQANKEHNNGTRVHPTQKPVALATWGFQRAGLNPGDLVLSPWLGSGPEARAAKDMGLRFVGVELVKEYLDACVERLRQGVLDFRTSSRRGAAGPEA